MVTSFRVFCISVVVLFCWSGVVYGSHFKDQKLQSLCKSVTDQSTILDNKYRTGYHFQPPMHWINDPNGPMYYNGIYHLFYQYNPKSAVWEEPVWAHSVSTDMINWIALDPAISPSKPFDIKGCWSGSATILPGNKPVILYTGIDQNGRQVQNIAFPKNVSDPYLKEWLKPDYNPIIAPDEATNATAFRDPSTAWVGPDKRWRLVIGSKRKHRGMAITYRSKDFVRWVRVKHPLHSSPDSGMWECPDFFPVTIDSKRGVDTSSTSYGKGLKYVFKVSLDLTRFEYYTIGSYSHELEKYVPDGSSIDNSSGLRFDYGNFYASKTFFDPAKKRRILWGWSNESDSRCDDITKGWAGIQTIPRAIWLDSERSQVVQWPIEEVESLRGKLVRVLNKKLKSGSLLEVSGIMTSQADVEVIFQLGSLAKAETFDPKWSDPQKLCEQKGAGVKGTGVGPFGLHVLASAKLEEHTSVFFRIFKAPTKYVALMCHDPSRSSLRPGLYKPTYGGFVNVEEEIQGNGKLYLRSLIDRSVVESFGGKGKTVMTSRIYPSIAGGDDDQHHHLYAFNNGAEDVMISKLKAWEMNKPSMNGA